MVLITITIYLITIPLLITLLNRKSSIFKKIGAIPILYLLGIGFHQIVPFDHYISTQPLYDFEEKISGITLLLAIPLLLFSINIKEELRQNKNILTSLLIALVSLLLATISGFFLFKEEVRDIAKTTGMLTGLYSGGTPNLAAIKSALNVNAAKMVLIVSYDFVIGAGLILFFITGAKYIFRFFLPTPSTEQMSVEAHEDLEDETNIYDRDKWKEMAYAFLISLFIVISSVAIGKLFSNTTGSIITILSATSLSIIAGQIPRINKLKGSFALGMLFILIFSFAIANMADFSSMQEIKNPALFQLMAWVIGCYITTHFILAYLFQDEADKTMVSMVAFTYSPVMVPIVCVALKNRKVLVYGITFGLFGYLIGNYLGILIASLLSMVV